MNGRNSIITGAVVGSITVVLVGGIGWAAIPGDGGTINACYGKVGGIVRVIDTAKREKCVQGLELPLTWNQQGNQGVPGGPGADGADGADGISPIVAQLDARDPNCPTGGASITDADGHVAYVCNGATGQAGADGDAFSGTYTSPNGRYAISITDTGIALSQDNRKVLTIADGDVTIENQGNSTWRTAGSTRLQSQIGLTVRSASTSIEADAVLDVEAQIVNVSGSGLTRIDSGVLAVHSVGSTSIVAGTRLDLAGHTAATLGASAPVDVISPLIRLNGGGGCLPVARQNDQVVSNVIATGATTVCAG